MYLLELFTFYFGWHYSAALKGIFSIWTNFIWFIWNFFSIGLLFRSWISPFKRMEETYKGGLDMNKIFETVIVNVLMRIVGFLMRTAVMAMGFSGIIALSLVGAIFTAVWLVLPAFIAFLIFIGFGYILP